MKKIKQNSGHLPQIPSFKCPLAYMISALRIALPLGLYRIRFDRRSHKEKMLDSSEKNDQGTKIPWLQTIFRMQVKMLQNSPREEDKLKRLLKPK
jgi:hypothetical protein